MAENGFKGKTKIINVSMLTLNLGKSWIRITRLRWRSLCWWCRRRWPRNCCSEMDTWYRWYKNLFCCPGK